MKRTPLDIAFILIALFFLVGAVYHVVGIALPLWVQPSPVWRHALFVAINLLFALGMLVRPRIFIALFCVLLAQQLYSHGTRACQMWSVEHRVDWASIPVLLGMPLVLALLAYDARRRS